MKEREIEKRDQVKSKQVGKLDGSPPRSVFFFFQIPQVGALARILSIN
jgi:hypothetical protein